MTVYVLLSSSLGTPTIVCVPLLCSTPNLNKNGVKQPTKVKCGFSNSMFEGNHLDFQVGIYLKKTCVDVGGSIPVYLNVYDITPINGCASWLGLGVYHSGVQVHGIEYVFGAHIHPSTGIFEGEPKKCKRYKFRKTVLIGWTELEAEEVKKVMKEFSKEYKGNAYNLITKNCNHFSNDVCIKLTGNHIPTWVNRLARIGIVFNCVIPVSLTTRKIQQAGTAAADS